MRIQCRDDNLGKLVRSGHRDGEKLALAIDLDWVRAEPFRSRISTVLRVWIGASFKATTTVGTFVPTPCSFHAFFSHSLAYIRELRNEQLSASILVTATGFHPGRIRKKKDAGIGSRSTNFLANAFLLRPRPGGGTWGYSSKSSRGGENTNAGV
jgi:hypothetical protein